MTDPKTVYIWPLETGITDLPEDVASMSVPSVRKIGAAWAQRRAVVGESGVVQIALDQLNREWAVHTGIIEGIYEIERDVTVTLIEHGFRQDVLTHGSTNGHSQAVLAHLQDHMNALELVFELVANRRPLSVPRIRELHAALTHSQDSVDVRDPHGRKSSIPLIRGDWKKMANFPERDGVRFHYCPPERVQDEMDRLTELHEEHIARDVPPEVEAAWIHHRFTQIHPFQDGNGRVARTLASVVLHRAGLFPFTILEDDKGRYIESLEQADNGDLRSLTETIARNQRRSYQRVVNAIEKATPEPTTLVEAAQRLADVAAVGTQALRARILRRVDRLQNWMSASMTTALELIAAPLASAHPLARIVISFSSPGSPDAYRADLVELVADRWHVTPQPPFSWVEVDGTLGAEWQIKVQIYATAPDIDEAVQAAATTNINSHWEAIEVEPFEWAAENDDGQVEALVRQWVDSVMMLSVGLLTRRLADEK